MSSNFKKTTIAVILIFLTAIFGCIFFNNNKTRQRQSFLKDNNPEQVETKKPDSVIVKFKPGQSAETKEKVLDKVGGEVETKINDIGAIETDPKTSVATAVKTLNQQPSVEYAEPNRAVEALVTPNDPYFGSQYGPKLISGPEGWDTEKGYSSPVTIAVVDTGVDIGHPDLNSKIVQGYDFINNDSNPSDDNGHGTHVAGISAATTNNSVGVAGTSWGAKIMPVKVLSASGSGSYASVSQGITWAADHGAKVINLSLGGYGFSQTMQNATDYARSKGVVVVAAAGNAGDTSILYPAGNRNVLGIGALDSSSKVASFSTHNSSVDLSAPGVNILGTYLRSKGYSYAYLSGTSMATPFAAGTAALTYSRFPGESASQIANRLITGSVDLGSAGRDDYYGYGRVDIKSSVTGGGGGGGQPEPAPAKSVTASINKTRVTRRGTARISGQITPQKSGERVVVQRKYSAKANWGTLARPTTNSEGKFSLAIRPRRTTYYRVIYGNTVNLKIVVPRQRQRRR